MYLWDCEDINFLNSKKTKNSNNFYNQRNFSLSVQQCKNFFDSKKFFVGSKKLFSEWKLSNLNFSTNNFVIYETLKFNDLTL